MNDETQAQESGGGINFRLVLGALAAVALALFIFQNTEDVEINFVTAEYTLPLSLLLVITAGLTLIVAVVVTWVLRRRDR